MLRPCLAAALGAALLPLLSAQQTIVVPTGMDTSYAGNTTLIWRSTAFRFQMLYDSTHWTDRGINHPISISRLRCRAINGTIDPGGQVYSGITVQMSTSPLDWNSMSTAFASNVGPDVATVFTGNLTLLPTNGGTPNDYYVDITLSTPFTYNPGSGLDLCVDVTAPTAPSFIPVPNTAAGSNALHKARRNSSATPTAATGALSYFAAVMLFDYTIPAGVAHSDKYGTGCYDQKVSFYEQFPVGTFDLNGSVGVTNSYLFVPNLQGGYTMVTGSNQWFTHTAAPLGLGDDAVSTPQPLSFTFPYPGGSTNALVVESNGNVWLQQPTHGSYVCDTSPTALLSRGPVFSACYVDLDPSPAGGGTVTFEESGGVAYVTWQSVPIWLASPPSPRATNSFQVAIYNSGLVEFRYQEIDTTGSWTPCMVGFSPGMNNRNPGPRDLSASVGMSTATDLVGLTLNASSRPLIGSTATLQVSEIPPAGLGISILILSFTQVNPGIDLASFGMPGCPQYVGLDTTFLLLGAPTASMAVTMPASPAWVGQSAYAQVASMVPGVNALGMLSSNGLRLQFGTL